MELKNWCVVGSFSKTLKGGTSTFCNLLFDDVFFVGFDFYRIDSTLDIIPKDLPVIRIRKSFIKFGKLFSCLFHFRPQGVMVLAGHGLGLFEKFVMLLIAVAFGKKTIFLPRSGMILTSGFDKFIFYCSVYFSNKVICQSKFWEHYVHTLNPSFKKKSVLVYNGIKPDNTIVKTERNIQYPFVILYVGWLEPSKGILDLIDTVKQLNSLYPEQFKLNILGKGSLDEKIKKIIGELPEPLIFQYGWINDQEKKSFFKNSNCLVLPSYYEGFPNVVLEAMNNNLPLICSNTTSLPEILDNGNCGILFSAGNKNELAKAILNIKNNPMEAMARAKNAKERVIDKFDIAESQQHILEVLMSFS